ncbi:hypothetical protein [Micromonospora yangpuensis]|uniref:PPE family protein n=1 Tax=Micromonospora yangpuensis TaxID=683228 RepID=A0A1C6U669_9ACTN|nr:hypothetical protein [Micromonospora yangpuensis]GGL91055.1 hypothetical protein GCM10012279_06090 [Micromonospora yangpuensis]SCL49522.1 hypothetical protein GA0070617_1207 [Micromonospora yangpuensis]
MIERGGGRTAGLTDWHLMSVPNMWACLQDQDTTTQWQQVAGWRKVCDLATTHLGRLHEYRRGLAQAWPPETNAAARAYLGELDDLIDRVQRTHDAAAANYTALSAATQAITTTRNDLKKIYDQYVAKSQDKQAYETMVADPKAVAGSRLPARPPVSDADLEALNSQARRMMSGLGSELQHAQVMLQKPPLPRSPIQNTDPDVFAITSTQAPIIPPIVPVPLPAAGNVSSNNPATTIGPVSTPTAPTTGPVLGGPAAGSSTPVVGPVLGGTGSGLIPAPAAVNLGSPATMPAAPSPSPGLGLGVPPIVSPGTTTGRGLPGPVHSPVGRLGTGSPHTVQPPPPRAMPPGGIIGGAPGMGLGQPGPGGVPPRRVNPIGGLIGGGGAGTGPTGGAGSRPNSGRGPHFNGHGMTPGGGAFGLGGAPGIGAAPSRPSRRDYEDADSRHWDPDHPWETDQGVAPVVRPPDEDGPIDPGPAIGLNR